MKKSQFINVNPLSQDIRYDFNVNHEGDCEYANDYDNTCDHDYGRCYRISGITVDSPREEDFKNLAKLVLADESLVKDKSVMDKIISIFKEVHQSQDFTDTSHYEWESEGDYYGDVLRYVKLNSSLRDPLIEKLLALNEELIKG